MVSPNSFEIELSALKFAIALSLAAPVKEDWMSGEQRRGEGGRFTKETGESRSLTTEQEQESAKKAAVAALDAAYDKLSSSKKSAVAKAVAAASLGAIAQVAASVKENKLATTIKSEPVPSLPQKQPLKKLLSSLNQSLKAIGSSAKDLAKKHPKVAELAKTVALSMTAAALVTGFLAASGMEGAVIGGTAAGIAMGSLAMGDSIETSAIEGFIFAGGLALAAGSAAIIPAAFSGAALVEVASRLAKWVSDLNQGEQDQVRQAKIQEVLKSFNIDSQEYQQAIERGRKKSQNLDHKKLQQEKNACIKEQNEIYSKISVISTDAMLDGHPESVIDQVVELNNKFLQKSDEIERLQSQIDITKGYGFSLAKRASELADIVEKEGADSNRAKWRAGVIQGEIKYGKIIDELASERETGKPAQDSYNKLLDALAKPNAPKAKILQATKSDTTALTQIYGDGSQYLDPRVLKIATSQIQELQKILNDPINVRLTVFSDRPSSLTAKGDAVKQYADWLKDFDFFNQGSDGIINLGSIPSRLFLRESGRLLYGYDQLGTDEEAIRGTGWHEAGHVVEIKRNLVPVSAAFREDRSAESPVERQTPAPSNMASQEEESSAALDSFLHPYVGLRYSNPEGGDNATEVISSGFEALATARLASRMALKDRENLLYVVSVVDQK